MYSSNFVINDAGLNFFGAPTETTPFLAPGQARSDAGQRGHILKAALYAFQNFYAFMLM